MTAKRTTARTRSQKEKGENTKARMKACVSTWQGKHVSGVRLQALISMKGRAVARDTFHCTTCTLSAGSYTQFYERNQCSLLQLCLCLLVSQTCQRTHSKFETSIYYRRPCVRDLVIVECLMDPRSGVWGPTLKTLRQINRPFKPRRHEDGTTGGDGTSSRRQGALLRQGGRQRGRHGVGHSRGRRFFLHGRLGAGRILVFGSFRTPQVSANLELALGPKVWQHSRSCEFRRNFTGGKNLSRCQ